MRNLTGRGVSLPVKRAAIETLESRQLLTAAPVPFHGVPYTEGQRIEAEDFDLGGQGVGYSDTTKANTGNAGYRTTEGVDIVTGGENGKVVGFTTMGEWLQYTVTVPATGPYTVQVRVSNPTRSGRLHVSFDSGKYVSNVVVEPATGSWDVWQTVSTGRVTLPAGKHVMKLYFDGNSASHAAGNIDWLRLTQATGPAADGWTIGAYGPAKRFEGYARSINGKLYTFGGYKDVNGFAVNQSYSVYNPATNKWTNLGTAPIPETHAGVTVDAAHGWIYFLGGIRGGYDGPLSTDVWKYDTTTNKWSSLPALPEPLAAGEAALVNGKLHYFGGIRTTNRYTDYNLHYVLDLNQVAAGSATWTTAAPMLTAKDHFGSAVVNGKIYIFGGEIGHDLLHLQQYEVDVYDPATNVWTRLADMPIARSHIEASTFVTNEGKIVVAGGQVDNFLATNSVMEFNPVTNHWTSLAPLPTPMEGTVVQQIGSKLIMTGGYDGVSGIASNQTWIGNWVAGT
ncbi:MAG TPA: carbohydrate-binding protein [Humisphaera sp.]|nr:carbohydrate-binding protein [Humisphaera sp.]